MNDCKSKSPSEKSEGPQTHLFLSAAWRSQADAESQLFQVTRIFRAQYAGAAAMFALQHDIATADVRRQVLAAAGTDDVADPRHVVDAVQRFQQDALFFDEILAVVGMKRLEFLLIEAHQFFDASAPPDVAQLEPIRRAVDFLKADMTKTTQCVHETVLGAADDANRLDGDAAMRETDEPRLFMTAAFADD